MKYIINNKSELKDEEAFLRARNMIAYTPKEHGINRCCVVSFADGKSLGVVYRNKSSITIEIRTE